MFGDTGYVRPPGAYRVYNTWRKAMTAKISPDSPLVIIELGCGTKVPSVRNHDEELLQNYPECVTLIRVNPAEPQLDCDGSPVLVWHFPRFEAS
jgi:hypothetical protein